MNAEDFDRIGFVTRRFGKLQGLWVMVPMGLWFLASGLTQATEALIPLGWSLRAGAVILAFRSAQYYLDRFGRVEPMPISRGKKIEILVMLLVGFAFMELFDQVLFPEGGMGLYAIAGFYFLTIHFWLAGEARREQVHYLILGALLLCLAIPGRSVMDFLSELRRPGLNSILIGLAMILAGLLDHQLLVRSLGQAPVFSEEATALEIES